MKSKIEILKELREERELLVSKKKEAYNNYIVINDLLFRKIEENTTKLVQISAEIKESALMEYQETGEKKLKYGIGIRIFKILEYSADDALDWAKSHKMALSLDKKSFEKIARAEPMKFVEIREVPQVQIPMKLEVADDE